MVSYQQILDMPFDTQPKNLKISSRSLKNYRREMKNFLMSKSIHLDWQFDVSIFKPVQNNFKFKSASQEAAVKFFYRRYMYYLCTKGNLKLENLISICLSGMYNYRFMEDFEIDSSSLNYVLQKLEFSPEFAIRLEKIFYLPSGFMESFSTIEVSDIKIPVDWWPKNLLHTRSVKLSHIENIWLSEKNGIDDKGYRRFLKIVEDVNNGVYFSGPQQKVIEYRRNYFIKVHFSQNTMDDLKSLIEYKTSDIQLSKRKKWLSEATIDKSIRDIKIYYRFLVSNPDNLNCLKSIREEDLSLAYLSSYDIILEYVRNYKKVSGIYSMGALNIVSLAISLLDCHSGWIFKNSYYRQYLPKDLRNSGKDFKSWKKYCKANSKKLKFLRREIKGSLRKSRDSQERARQILRLESPIFAVREALEYSYEMINAEKDNTVELAIEVQYHVLIFMLLCFPLRAKNWSLMQSLDYHLDGSFIRKDDEGYFYISVKADDLKNRTSKKFKDVNKIHLELSLLAGKLGMSKHLKILERFIYELRPLISENNSLFNVKREGKFIPASPSQISVMAYRWTSKYLASNSSFPSRIIGLPPLRAHVFRNIVATHYNNHNMPKMAAYALADSEDIVRMHYTFGNFNSEISREIRRLPDQIE